ncbi:MAG: alpha/beta fold hydrolase [Pseudomonadota bacterium]|jgi:Predicted hydrolases or acyltransferases (alpha/beta hydrolase superfamily)
MCARRSVSLLLLISLFHAGFLRAEPPPHHRFHIEGSGTTTVVFEAGLGDTLEVWSAVQPLVAMRCARTFSYNRAGYPGSDPASGRRDAEHIVEELRMELRRQGLTPPYILVGHSLGGLYMQYFARNFPQEVSGLVLVDSTHWNELLPLEDGALRTREGSTAMSDPLQRRRVVLFMTWIVRREIQDSALAGEQVRNSPYVPGLPTVVLSSTRAALEETPATRARAARRQDEIAADFPASRHIRVVGAGHYIQRDQPRVVVEAVRRLAGCETDAATLRDSSGDGEQAP